MHKEHSLNRCKDKCLENNKQALQHQLCHEEPQEPPGGSAGGFTLVAVALIADTYTGYKKTYEPPVLVVNSGSAAF